MVQQFHRNKIVIFPQTIFFHKKENLERAKAIFAEHPDLTICARDQRSYRTAQVHFPHNQSLLVPDMAFFMDLPVQQKAQKNLREVLFFVRRDKELKEQFALPYLKQVSRSDWPSFENGYYHYLRNKEQQSMLYLHEGIRFLLAYDVVISTRLHGGILATLLGIPTILLDNSYGKNRVYYETWLKDIAHCHFASDEDELRDVIYTHFPELITGHEAFPDARAEALLPQHT